MTKPEKIAAIASITQIFKYYGVPSSWCPAVAIALGAILEYGENPNAQGLMDGVILGAVVTGAFGMIKGAGTMAFAKPAENFSDLEADDDRGV